jgi:hypothetical protein
LGLNVLSKIPALKERIKNIDDLKIVFTVFCGLISFFLSAQIHINHSHRAAGRTFHRTRIVPQKHYGQIADSSTFSTEFIISNSNTWTGESYGPYPSLQTLISYDNNKNTELGVFGCYNHKGFNNNIPSGIDLFFVRKLNPKASILLDVYTFLNNKDSLMNYFGYKAKTYNLYSAYFKYDFVKELSLILGYSVLNNPDSIQRAASVELDFNATKSLTLVFVYSTGPHIFNGKEAVIGSGFGFQSTIGHRIKYGLTYSPPFYDNLPSYYSSFMLMAAVNLSRELYKLTKPLVK